MNTNLIACISWIGLVVLLLGTNSCEVDPCGSAPADLIENLEDLVKEVGEKDYNPKDDRWQTYDSKFQTYFEDCYDRWSPDMTGHQKAQFTGLVTRYIANRFGKSLFRSFFSNSKSDSEDIPESIKQIGEDVKGFLEENNDTGMKVFEDLINEISEWFDNEQESK